MMSSPIAVHSASAGERELWEREFSTLRVIPSSTRPLPSKALLLFSELLQFQDLSLVLDAGCGTGRNAIYLARKGATVHALDFCDVALQLLRQRAIQSGVSDRILAYNFPLNNPLPFPDDHFDLALDSYVSCHFISEGLREHYHRQLRRVLKPGGYLFSSQFGVDDSYYGPLLVPKYPCTGGIVTDQRNQIKKRLYTESEAQSLFRDQLELRYYAKLQFEDIVAGTAYRRSILVLVAQKPVE